MQTEVEKVERAEKVEKVKGGLRKRKSKEAAPSLLAVLTPGGSKGPLTIPADMAIGSLLLLLMLLSFYVVSTSLSTIATAIATAPASSNATEVVAGGMG